jgi:hypothetical protein
MSAGGARMPERFAGGAVGLSPAASPAGGERVRRRAFAGAGEQRANPEAGTPADGAASPAGAMLAVDAVEAAKAVDTLGRA